MKVSRVRKCLECSSVLWVLTTTAAWSNPFPLPGDKASEDQLNDPFSIQVLYLGLKEKYEIDEVTTSIPGVVLQNVDAVNIDSDSDSIGLRFNAWVFPFLRAFALVSDISGSTNIDLSSANVTGLPIQPPNLEISIDGRAYGAGFDLVCCNAKSNWFASLSYSYTETNVTRNFDSTIESITIQPRLGLRAMDQKVAIWVAALYVDSKQEHEGILDFENPLLPPIPVSARIKTTGELSYGVGANYKIADNVNLNAEHHFTLDERDYTFVSATWAF